MSSHFAERYAIQRELGRGSFGVVYLATDRTMNRPVALKILHAALAVNPATVQLFMREAAILAQLDHDHIVPVYDLGVSGDARYIVMKYVAGASLAEVLAQEGAQPVERVLAWLRQIAAGLDYAHSKGVLHRDLKPGNLLLDAARERILITDFGLAHAVQQSGGSSQQSQQESSGTVGYLAPEVLLGEPATTASDRYSLGCVLYALLAGRPPFTGDNAMSIMYQHEYKTPPALKLSGVAGAALAAQVAALLAKQPGERPASAQAVVAAVAAAEAGPRPASAQAAVAAVSAGEMKQRPAHQPRRRSYWLVGAGLVAALALLAVLFWPQLAGLAPAPATPTVSAPNAASATITAPGIPQTSAGTWGIIASRLDANMQQTWVANPQSVGAAIKSIWAQGYDVSALAYGDRGWVVVGSKRDIDIQQSYGTSNAFPTAQIRAAWADGYDVAAIAFGDGLWTYVTAKTANNQQQALLTAVEFPGTQIRDYWEKGYSVTALAYGDGVWALIATKTAEDLNQVYGTTLGFPGDEIQVRWEQGYDITLLTYGGGLWAYVGTRHEPGWQQRYLSTPVFPASDITAMWSSQYDVTAIAYGGF